MKKNKIEKAQADANLTSENDESVKASGFKNALAELGKNKFLLTFVCVFLSITMIFGIVFGTVFMVRKSSSVLNYGGVGMSAGVANYFASYSKAYFISTLESSGVDVKDTEEFWSTKHIGTRTYGDELRDYVEKTIRQIAVGVYLFDLYSALTSNEKQTIKQNAEQRLLYISEGDKGEFNDLTEPYGFDYSDFEKATEMMYKAKMAQYAVYGNSGENLVGEKSLADSYYNAYYTRAKLLFIRTENDFVLNDDGERVVADDGYYEMRELDSAERDERLADVEEIRRLIANYEAGDNEQMSPVSFDLWLDKYKATNMYLDKDGQYYSPYSSFTSASYEELPEVIDTVLLMGVGAYDEVEFEIDGETCYCFIYADTLEENAYTDTSDDGYFSDFYSLLATHLYTADLDELSPEVELLDRFYKIDLVKLKPNGVYTIGI